MTTKTGPAYPRVTPRRSIVMADDVWEPIAQLAKRRGINASAMLRVLALAEIERAREAGELPKVRRGRAA